VAHISGLERALIHDEYELATDSSTFVRADSHLIVLGHSGLRRAGRLHELRRHDSALLPSDRHGEVCRRQIRNGQPLPIEDVDIDGDQFNASTERWRLSRARLLSGQDNSAADEKR
jgi:hypothetical protein